MYSTPVKSKKDKLFAPIPLVTGLPYPHSGVSIGMSGYVAPIPAPSTPPLAAVPVHISGSGASSAPLAPPPAPKLGPSSHSGLYVVEKSSSPVTPSGKHSPFPLQPINVSNPLIKLSSNLPIIPEEEEKMMTVAEEGTALPLEAPELSGETIRLPSIKRKRESAPSGIDLTVVSQPISDEDRTNWAKKMDASKQFSKIEWQKFQTMYNNNEMAKPASAQLGPNMLSAAQLANIIDPSLVMGYIAGGGGDKIYNDITKKLLEIAKNRGIRNYPWGMSGAVLEDLITSKEAKGSDARIRQLADIVHIMLEATEFDVGLLQRDFLLPKVFRKRLAEVADAKDPLRDEKRAEFNKLLDNVLVNNRIYHYTADKLAKQLLTDKRLRNMHKFSKSDDQYLKELIADAATDRSLREANQMDDEDFIQRNAFYLQDLQTFINNRADKATLTATLGTYNRKIRNQTAADYRIFNNRIDNLQDLIDNNPNDIVSKKLQEIIHNIEEGLLNKKIDLEEAYGKINGIYNQLRPHISYDTGRARLKPLKVLQPKLVTEERIGPPQTDLALGDEKLEAENKNAVEDLEKVDEEMRSRDIFAFPNLKVTTPKAIPVLLNGKYLNGDSRTQVESATEFALKRKLDIKGDLSGAMTTDFSVTLREIVDKPTILDGMTDKQLKELVQAIKGLDKVIFTDLASKFNGPLGKIIKFDFKTLPSFETGKSGKIASPKHAKRLAAAGIAKAYAGVTVPSSKVFQNDILKFGEEVSSAYDWTRDFRKAKKPDIGKGTVSDLKKIIPIAKGKQIKATRLVKPAAVISFAPPAKQPPEAPRGDELKPTWKEKKKFASESFQLKKEVDKETPELMRAEYGNKAIEFHIKTEADLQRMKSEISKIPGKLYIIDLKTGKLYPIEIEKTFIKQSYVFIKDTSGGKEETLSNKLHEGHKIGGSFAFLPVKNRILREQEDLLPYIFMRNGNDKAPQMAHRAASKEYFNDYRDQVRKELGGSVWSHIKKGLKEVGKQAGNYMIRKSIDAGKDLIRDTSYEGQNFINREKKNVNYIANANKQLYKNPSFGNLNKAINRTVLGGVRMIAQPALTTVRQAANVSDFVSDLPVVGVAKKLATTFIPVAGVTDALIHGVKNVDEGNYYDAALNAGDAILDSRVLNGSVASGARLLQIAAKVADKYADPEAHQPKQIALQA